MAQLLDHLQRLTTAQLVTQRGDDAFAFRHALTRDAVYVTILRRERRLAHQAVAETLEQLFADSLEERSAELAYHYFESEMWAKALAYAQRAGDRAQSQFAPREAIDHYTRALHAARQLQLATAPQLLRARGLARETLGEFDAAQSDYQAALESARRLDDRRSEWLVLLDLGQLWASRDYARTGDYYREALEFARATGDEAALAHSLNRLGNWHFNAGRPIHAKEYHLQALQIFEGNKDRRGLAQTLDFLGLTLVANGDLVAGTHYYERAITLFHELGDRRGLSSSLAVMGERSLNYFTSTYVPVSTLPEAVEYASQALAIARDIGWRAGEAYAQIVLGDNWLALGEHGRALAAVDAGLRISLEIGHHQWQTFSRCTLVVYHLELLNFALAQQECEQAIVLARSINSLVWIPAALVLLGAVQLAQGNLAAIESLLAEALAGPLEKAGPFERVGWCIRAEAALACQEPGKALSIVESLIASTPNLAPGQVIPRLWGLRAEALAALGRAAEAETALKAAQASAAAWQARPMLWRLHLALAGVYLAHGRQAEAEGERAKALAVVTEIAATIPAADLREQFVHAATRLIQG